MESDSDWDSLTADGPAIGEKSVSGNLEVVKGELSPRPPTYDKITRQPSPVPLSVAFKGGSGRSSVVGTPPDVKVTSSKKQASRVAESYRHGQPHGVTVFHDAGNGGIPSETGSRASKSNLEFDEVELADRSQYETSNRRHPKFAKSQLPENLPYTDFQVGHDHNQNRVPDFGKQVHSIKTEYVRQSPDPRVDSPRLRSHKEIIKERPVLRRENETIDAERDSPAYPNQQAKRHPKMLLSPSKKKQPDYRKGRISGLGITNNGAEINTDEEANNTDNDVSWGNDVGSVNVKIREIEKGSKRVAMNEENEFISSERIYYQRMNLEFYTVPPQPQAVVPQLAQKWQGSIRRGWQEFFGALQIVTDFIVLFVIELVRFLAKQFVKLLLVGVLQGLSDLAMKPLLAVFYNGLFQPLFTFLWNVLNGTRNLFQPCLMVLHEVVSQIALLLNSIRLVEINANRKGKGGPLENV